MSNTLQIYLTKTMFSSRIQIAARLLRAALSFLIKESIPPSPTRNAPRDILHVPNVCVGMTVNSEQAGEDAVRHRFAVLVPSRAILPPTLMLISGLPMHQQDDQVNQIEIRNHVIKTCRSREMKD